MYSLIITIVAIALVAVLALVSIYYGGNSMIKGKKEVDVAAVTNQGQQLSGAFNLYKVDRTARPDSLESLIAESYLQSVPYFEQSVWREYATGTAVVLLPTALTKESCQLFNLRHLGMNGIPSNPIDSTKVMRQCYGAGPKYHVLWNVLGDVSNKQATDSAVAAGRDGSNGTITVEHTTQPNDGTIDYSTTPSINIAGPDWGLPSDGSNPSTGKVGWLEWPTYSTSSPTTSSGGSSYQVAAPGGGSYTIRQVSYGNVGQLLKLFGWGNWGGNVCSGIGLTGSLQCLPEGWTRKPDGSIYPPSSTGTISYTVPKYYQIVLDYMATSIWKSADYPTISQINGFCQQHAVKIGSWYQPWIDRYQGAWPTGSHQACYDSKWDSRWFSSAGWVNSPYTYDACPTGYTGTVTCSLSDASLVMKPLGTSCQVMVSGDKFVFDPKNPTCPASAPTSFGMDGASVAFSADQKTANIVGPDGQLAKITLTPGQATINQTVVGTDDKGNPVTQKVATVVNTSTGEITSQTISY